MFYVHTSMIKLYLQQGWSFEFRGVAISFFNTEKVRIQLSQG